MRNTKTYDQEFKEKLVKEYEDIGNLSEVCRRHSIPITTLRAWVINKDPKKVARKIEKREVERLQKELSKKELEIEILKELLKKTNRAWLKD